MLSTADEFRRSWDDAPMNRPQILAVVLTVLLAALDGFDVQSMALVAPVVGKAWAISRTTLGLALASSLFGMAVGSIGLSPLADIFGRKPVVLGSLVLMTVGALALSRALTGLGIGVMVSLTNTLSAEFSNSKRRALSVAVTTTGFGVGGIGGGLLASIVLRAHPWTWVFFSGAAAGAALLLVVLIALPESPAYLLGRKSSMALERRNRVLTKLGRPSVAALPTVEERSNLSLQSLRTPELVSLVFRFAIPLMFLSMSAYYLISWLPQLITDAGFSPATASLASAASSLVGIAAALLFGALGARFSPLRLASLAMIGFGLALAFLGLIPPVLALFVIAAAASGFFMQGGVASTYASMAVTFPAAARVSCMGIVLGLGRLSSGVGPYAAGALFSAGWTRTSISLLFAGVAIAAGCLLALGFRNRTGRPSTSAPLPEPSSLKVRT
jgi:AAHS family 4-hydroxybenzoate transporter-like MFS transporter